MIVVVTGPPASGKSTLARRLADRLGVPLLAKDEIKEALMRGQPPADVHESRELGRRAVRALLDRARDETPAVLDSVWVDRPAAVEQLSALGRVVEVFCRCDLETMRRRYVERAATKGGGHFDLQRPDDELWPAEALGPLAGPWRVVEVDTSREVDVPRLAQVVREPA